MARPTFSLTAQQKKILAGIGAGVGFILWLTFFFTPQFVNWIQRRPQVQGLKAQIQEARQRLGQFPKREKELSDLKTQYELSGANLISQQQLPELLEKIAQAARSAGVRLEAVKPKVDISQLTPGPSGYLELPLEVDAVAGYHGLGVFLDTLERSDNLIRVQEFKIQADPKDLWNHQATFVLQSYLLPDGKSEGK